MNRAKWNCAAMSSRKLGDESYPSGVLFIGEQSGVAKALKDCEVPQGWGWACGLNKGQYQLASTGKVKPKLLRMDLYGRAQVF